MKVKYLIPIFLGCALAANANGYKDGIEYYKAGQYDNAMTILQRTLNDASTDKAMAYYYIGQTALVQGDKAAAAHYFDQGVAADPQNAYNHVGKGEIALLNGDIKAAESEFKQAQKLGKKNNEITVDIARAYYNADPVKYAAEVEKYLNKARKDSKYKEPAIYILEGDMALDNEDVGGAAAKYEQAITFDESNPEGYVKYANAYIYVNPLFSVGKLEELLSKKPNSALAQRELSEKYYETSQWTKAAEQYGKYIQNPNHFPEDKVRYSVLLYANSEYQKSLDVANELLSQYPNDFQLLRIRMLDLAALERNQEADAAAQRFFALNPDPNGKAKFMPNDYITYAGVLENMGQDSLALIQYEAAAMVDPTKYDNFKTLSSAYTKAGKYQQAADAFASYLEANPSPSLTDYLQASGRYLNAANRAENDEIRTLDADAGIAAINEVINRTSELAPEYIQRRGRLELAKAKNVPDETVKATYEEILRMLDADPANADKNNPKNKRGLYKEAYFIIGNYYQAIEDDENKEINYQLSDSFAD